MSEAKREGIIIPVSLAKNLREALSNNHRIVASNFGSVKHPNFLNSILERLRICLSADSGSPILDLRSGEARFFIDTFAELQQLRGDELISKLVKGVNKSVRTVCDNAMEESANRLCGDEFEKMLGRLLNGETLTAIRESDYFGRRTVPWFKTEGLKILKNHMPADEAEQFLDLLLRNRDTTDEKYGTISCLSLLESLKLLRQMKK